MTRLPAWSLTHWHVGVIEGISFCVKCCESVMLGSGKRVFLLLVADALRLRAGRYVPGMSEPAVATGSGPACASPGGYRADVHRVRRRTWAAISLDCDYVSTSAPPQVRCYDNSPVILPGADEVLKLGDRHWLSQVLNCAIDPA
jgi:hypothetical protein